MSPKKLEQKIKQVLLNKNVFYQTKDELALKITNNIIEEIKEWLQQKQKDDTVYPYQNRTDTLIELLKELE